MQQQHVFAKHLMRCLTQSEPSVNDSYCRQSIAVTTVVIILWDSGSLLLPTPTFSPLSRNQSPTRHCRLPHADGRLGPRAGYILSPHSLKCYNDQTLCEHNKNSKTWAQSWKISARWRNQITIHDTKMTQEELPWTWVTLKSEDDLGGREKIGMRKLMV